MTDKIKKYIDEKKYTMFFSLLLIVINCIGIQRRYLPWFIDEFGYWASGALLRGYNWNNVMSYSGYYGFGYGIILSLLISIPSIKIRYYCAEIINVILIVFIYLLLNSIFNIITENKRKKLIAVICVVSMLYPYIIVYTHTTQAEIFITFLYVWSIYLLLQYYKNKRCKYAMLLLVCSFMMFSVHLRTLVAIISLLLTLAYIAFSEKNRKISITIVSIVIILFLVWKIKDIFIQILYKAPSDVMMGLDKEEVKTIQNSSMSAYLWTISQLTNIKTILLLIRSIEGKVFYCAVSTFGFTIISTYNIIKKIVKADKKMTPFYIYIILSFWGQVVLTSVSMYNINRFDHLMYGRYSEAFILPLIVEGIYWGVNNRKSNIYFCLYAIFILSLAINLYDYVKNIEFSGCISMQISGISGYDFFADADIRYVYTIIVVMIVLLISMLLWKANAYNKKIFLIIIAIVWLFVGENTLKNNLYVGYQTANQLEDIVDIIESDKTKVYYLLTSVESEKMDSAWRNMFYLQYMLMDKIIYPIDEKKIGFIEEGSIVVIEKSTQNYKDYMKYTNVAENDLFVIDKK